MNPSPSRRLQALAVLVAFLCQILAPFATGAPATVPQLLNYQGRVTVGGANFNGTGYFKFSLVDGGTNQNQTASATCVVNGDGAVREVQVTNSGTGYPVPPEVTITGTGTDARAEAVLEGGRVSEIILSSGGSGYSQVTPTTVTIAPPPVNLVLESFWSNDSSASNGQEPQHAVARAVTKGLYSVLLGDADMEALKPNVFAHPDVRLRVWFSPKEGEGFTLLTPDQRIAAVGYALMADDVKDGAITSAKLAADAVTLAQLSPELRQTINGLQAWQATQLPVVTSGSDDYAAVDNVFTYQITATGAPTSWAATGLPAGWSVNAAGLVSATPSAAGLVTFNVTATNVAGTSAPKLVSVTVTGPVFVDFATGSDGNTGTQAAPVKTVAQGISVAITSPVARSVRVSGAAQTFSTPLALAGGVNVRGGYDRAAGWTRTAPRTPLNYSPAATTNPTAVWAEALSAPVLLDGFAITSPNAALANSSSSIGVRVRNCPQAVTLSNNTIIAGNGTGGLGGSSGGNGVAGAAGFEAVSWRGPYYPADLAFSPAHPPYYFKGMGGMYYNSANYYGTAVSPWEGWPGSSGLTLDLIATAGGAPSNGAASGGNGSHGAAGAGGSNGSNGAAGSALHLATNIFSSDGGDGTIGGSGTNGNDGGGGGGITNGPATLWGGGGGGGGKGGHPGGAGRGGKGAGGAFAVVVENSTVVITDCTLTTGNAGNGGAGGNGGNSSFGGNGGPGFVTPAVGASNPGNGGWGGGGGNGGSGGGGAGGNGGPSIGIITGTGATLTQSGNTFTLGNAGTGGLGGLRGSSTTVRAASGTAGLRQNILTGVAP